MPTLAEIVIGEPDWLWPAAAIVALALGVLAWGYARSGGGRRWLAPAICKALALVLLAAFLVNPLWSTQRATPRANLFLVVIDGSSSLNIREKNAALTRADELRQALTHNANPTAHNAEPTTQNAEPRPPVQWWLRLSEQFDARAYSFDTRLRAVDRFDEITFDGRGTALSSTLRTLADRYHGRPVAGVLLFTDGNATDGAAAADLLAAANAGGGAGAPVYPVIVGRDDHAADVGIASLAVTQSAFEDAPVTVQAEVSAAGFAGKMVAVQLIDSAGNVVQSQSHKIEDDAKSLAVRFQFKPQRTGVSFYRLRVGEARGGEASRNGGEVVALGEITGEATAANNERWISIDRGRGPYRVLYVSGRPNFEYKFLSRAISEDKEVNLVGLIRIARREAKFAYRDNREDSVNPLFRGFDLKGKGKDDVEQFDEPVLVRLNTESDAELRGGFPKTAEDLFRYHAIILDDVESAFFSRDQLSLLEKFVTQRRGGLLMLGGVDSLREGDYHKTPIGRMLPVYLDRAVDPVLVEDREFRLDLTRPGWHETFMRLRGTELEETQRLAAMPAFRVLSTTPSVKPGATILAEARDDTGARWPALIVQPFGGRVAVATVGDHWRWAIKREETNEDIFKMWRQLVRWLTADVPGRVEIAAQSNAGTTGDPALSPALSRPPAGERGPDAGVAPGAVAGGAVRLVVRVRDRNHQAMDGATVAINVQPAAGPTVTLRASPSLAEPGLYEASYLPREEGSYLATAKVTDADGKAMPDASAGWTRNSAAEEFASLKPNRALLEQLAKQTGGQTLRLDQLDDFVAGLSSRKAPVMETAIEPLWHRWWMLALAIGCLVGEWGLRRMRGLP